VTAYDPVQVELFGNLLSGVAEEMGVALQRSAFSANIKERRDFSCALFDARGRMVAQAENIPVHLGSMPASVAAAVEEAPPGPGEMVLLNDPFHGGTHLPDLTLVAPFLPAGHGEPAFYVANRAHHADVGGMSPGSMPLAREIFQEGLVIPPVRLVRGDHLDPEILRLLLANVRTPDERRGDLAAQVAACRMGVRRLQDLGCRYGIDVLQARAADAMAYAESMMRATLEAIPQGEYAFEDRLDDDGGGGPAAVLRVRVSIRGDRATVDFTGSAEQVRGCLNAVGSITRSAVYYVFRCLAGDRIPSNHGCFAPLEVILPTPSILDAVSPAAVAGGNVETSQRVVDVLFGALAEALPDRIPAASQGTMNNLAFGGNLPGGERFAYYETVAGGCGGGPRGPGAPGMHSHMTNSRNTPVEALEHALPVRVRRYGIRRGSGGAGAHPGGDGLVRELEFLSPAEVTLLGERRKLPPWGLRGGGPGRPGRNRLLRRDGPVEDLPGKCVLSVAAGDRIRVETPGAGGWGELDGGLPAAEEG
jgi:N-methylhydantoinase B